MQSNRFMFDGPADRRGLHVVQGRVSSTKTWQLAAWLEKAPWYCRAAVPLQARDKEAWHMGGVVGDCTAGLPLHPAPTSTKIQIQKKKRE